MPRKREYPAADLDTFAGRLRFAMDAQIITAKRLAVNCRIDEVSVLDYLAGKRKPRMETMKALAKALNVSFDWLRGMTDMDAMYAPRKRGESVRPVCARNEPKIGPNWTSPAIRIHQR